MFDAFLAQFFEGVLLMSLMGACVILLLGMGLRWALKQSIAWWNR